MNGIHGAPGGDAGGGGVVVGAPVAEARGENVVGVNGVHGGGAAVGVNGGGDADSRAAASAVDRPASSSSVRSNDSGGSGGGGGGRSPSPLRRARVSGSWPPRPDSFSFHTVMKALATVGMWEDAVELLEEMAEERWVGTRLVVVVALLVFRRCVVVDSRVGGRDGYTAQHPLLRNFPQGFDRPLLFVTGR